MNKWDDPDYVAPFPPGSEEAIRHYRRQVELGLPTGFADPRPKREKYVYVPESEMTEARIEVEKIEEQMGSILDAVDKLTDPAAIQELDAEIEILTRKIQKLRSVRRMIGSDGTGRGKQDPIELDPAEEQKVLDAVARKPLKPKEIEGVTGISYCRVGKIVRASAKLAKAGAFVTLAE